MKGHNGTEGNEESDRLAKLGANKDTPDELNLKIPSEFDIQGAKLATLTQAMAYRGILERKKPELRNSTKNNLRLTRDAILQTTNEDKTEATIWNSTRKPSIRPIVQQFLYKTMHDTFITGKRWRDFQGLEDREICATCNTTNDMSHILTRCQEQMTQLIWTLAKDLWPHRSPPWPEIHLGTILGCGYINAIPRDEQQNEQRERKNTYQGLSQLLQILISEAAYLVWVLRCERVIQGKHLSENEIRNRWLRNINKRLTNDKITATRIRRDDGFTNLVVNTWEPTLEKERALPPNWIKHSEVLVGRTA